MDIRTPKLAIVSPCYNEELLIESTGEKLAEVLDILIKKGKISSESFVYFVNDGSTDSTWTRICELNKKNSRIKGVLLSKNFGYQNAILTGLLKARENADCLITIDSDLQDDLSVIEKFIDSYQEGYDIVYGVKASHRKDSLYKKYGNKLFYLMMRLMGSPIINNHAEFRFTSKRVIDALSEFGEVNLFLRGMFREIGFKTKQIEYPIKERAAGESKFTLKKLLSLALDGITSFSIVPLRIIAFIGLGLLVVSVVLLTLIIVGIVPARDLMWVFVVLLFIGGLNIGALGVVGEYIGKIYMETKSRPRYIIDKELW